MSPVLEERLRTLIDYVREGQFDDGRWAIPGVRTSTGEPPLVVGLARFQSYRARTEAALVEELTDYVETAGLSLWVHLKVIEEESQVLIW
jgi:hypothetical protein